jgi:Spy/CpxP family protein refolding chaperone
VQPADSTEQIPSSIVYIPRSRLLSFFDRHGSRRRVISTMITKSTKTLIVASVLVVTMAVSAFAQAPGTQKRGQRAGKRAQSTAGQRVAGAGSQDRAGAFANLQRILMPPSRKDLEKMNLALGLTDDQKAKVNDLYTRFYTAVRAVAPDRAAAVKQVMSALQGTSSNKGELQSAASKVQQADSSIMNAEFDFWIGLKGILNTQQQGQLNTYMLERAQKEFAPKTAPSEGTSGSKNTQNARPNGPTIPNGSNVLGTPGTGTITPTQ